MQRFLYSGNALPRGGLATPTPAPDDVLGDMSDMVIAGDGEAVEEYPYSKKLVRGSTGESVKQVQTRLTELGFSGMRVRVTERGARLEFRQSQICYCKKQVSRLAIVCNIGKPYGWHTH